MQQKVALVTGASSGIGEATARKLNELGYTVYAAARRLERMHPLKQQGINIITLDVTDDASMQGAITEIITQSGRLDVLINNAGLGGEVDVVDMTDDQWHRVLDVTLTSLFRMTRAFLPTMYAAKSGAMVNNASVLGWRAQKGQAHYAAAKAGVMAFTRCSAIEAAEYGVRINAVSPSLAMHPFLAKVTTQETLDKLVEREAFKRPAEVWEIANVMMFLASDLASYMTGEIVSVSSQRA